MSILSWRVRSMKKQKKNRQVYYFRINFWLVHHRPFCVENARWSKLQIISHLHPCIFLCFKIIWVKTGNKGGLLGDLRQRWCEASTKFIRQGFLRSFITWQSWLRSWEFFPWCPGKIALEAAFPKSMLNFHWIYSWTILSLASNPIQNCWEIFPGVEIWKGFMTDSSFNLLVSLLSSDVLDFFFLLSSFEVLIAENKEQTLLTFDNSKSHSSRFSQIKFQACWISSLRTLQTHLTRQNTFSQLLLLCETPLYPL